MVMKMSSKIEHSNGSITCGYVKPLKDKHQIVNFMACKTS